MYINLANIDFGGEGGGKAVLQETTIESLLTETTKVVTPPEGVDGFNKVTVTHAPVETLTEATITSNGETTITPSAGFDATFGVKVVTNVPTTDVSANYRYKQPVADDTGLKAIGWDDDSINYFKYNNYVYPWEANNYKVSDANKQIVINHTYEISQYKDNPDFKYCPFFDTAGEIDMYNMFLQCKNMYSIPILNTDNVTNMGSMFFGCSNLISIPLLNTSNVTYMGGMFFGCSNLTSIPQLDTGKVDYMRMMFRDCQHLTSIPQLDTGKVTNMEYMFFGCSALESIPLLNTSNVTSVAYMFNYCKSLTSIPQLDTSKVTDMQCMFQECYDLTSIPQLATGNVTNMEYMFEKCNKLTSIPQLDTGKVTNTGNMFSQCTSLSSVPRLNAVSLTSAANMFGYSFVSLDEFTDFGGLTGLKINLDLSPCPKLTHDSLLNVINEAADVTASPKTLTLGSTNLAKLTDEEKAIATNKGWALA